MSIVINTPTGNIGSALTKLLVDVGAPLTLISRSAARLQELAARGARVIEGSLDDRSTLDRALTGASALFWVTPTTARPDYCEWARDAAERAAEVAAARGVRRIVHVSSAGLVEDTGSGLMAMAFAIEQAFQRAAPDVVALRPGYFMENLLGHLDGIASGTLRSWAPAELRMPMVAAQDIAAHAASYLLAQSWQGPHVAVLQGPQHLSLCEVCAILSECLGRSIAYEQAPLAQLREERLAAGHPAALVDIELEGYRIVLDSGMRFIEPRTPQSTTPTTLRQFIAASLKPALSRAAPAQRLPGLSAEELASARLPLAQATTLSPCCYTSAEFYALEVERVFRKQWLCVGRVEKVSKPGDYYTLTLLGEPLVVVRDKAGQLHVLSRACRHRGTPVVEGAGNRTSFQCPYHLWTYALSGELLGAPEMQKTPGFDRSSCRLPEVRTEVWEGFIFINFDARAQPLGPALAPLQRQLANYRIGELRALPATDYDSPWNWKLLVENFIEAYHHIGPHSDTVEPYYPARLARLDDHGELYALTRLQPSPSGLPEPLLPQLPGLSKQEQQEQRIVIIYPCHLMVVSADSVIHYQLLPDTVERFTLRVTLCLPESLLADPKYADTIAQIHQAMALIHQQDIEVCRALQQGMRAHLARPGRLCHLEKSIWLFNQYLLNKLLAG